MSDVSYIHIQIQVSMYGTTWYNLAGLGLWYLYHHWHCHCAFTAKKWKTIDVYYPGVVETCVIWEREVSSIKLPTMSIQGNETQSWSFSNHPGILARIGT